MSLLELKNVNISYKTPLKTVYAVQDVSLVVEEQESVGIVGESGSGKSTLAMGILRLLPDNITVMDGEALLNGQDLISMEEKDLQKVRWKEVSVVFQKAMNALSPVHKIGAQMEDIYLVHYPDEDKQKVLPPLPEIPHGIPRIKVYPPPPAQPYPPEDCPEPLPHPGFSETEGVNVRFPPGIDAP